MTLRIAVIGAASKTGEAIIKMLDNNPAFELYAFCQNDNFQKVYDTIPLIKATPLDFSFFKRQIFALEPDVIINTIGFNDVAACEKNKTKAWEANVKAVENITRAAKIPGIKLIQISSVRIFSGKNGPYDETARPNPSGYFGKTKLAAENVIISSLDNYAIVRVPMVFGHSAFAQYDFVHDVITKLGQGERIFVSENEYLNPVFAPDLALVVAQIIKRDIRGIFNAGNRDIISLFDFARIVADVFFIDKSLITALESEKNNSYKKFGLINLKTETALGIKLPMNRDAVIAYRKNGNKNKHFNLF